MKKLICILSLIILSLASCHKDTDFENTENTTTTTTQTIDNAQDGIVYGLVTDRDGKPIAGASVSIYDQSTVTDQFGVFKTEGLLSPTGSLVKVEAEGYFNGSDLLYSNTKKGYTEITLIKKNNVKTFDAGSGGEVSIDGGGDIVFPSGAIVKEDGSTYGGKVNIYAKRIATDDPDFFSMMPGGLVADDADGRTVVLGSMGMVAVEMYDESGNKLQVKDGYTAKTTFPIAEDMRSIAKETIKTWSYDEDKGRWIEEGVAKKVGNDYVAEIPHFSFWNCDAPFPLVKLQGRMVNEAGDPIEHISIQINAEGFGIGYGYSIDGSFCGKIPKGAEFSIEVFNVACQGPIYAGTYGPYTDDVDLGDIVLEYSPNKVQGTIYCLEDVVEDGYILLEADFTYVYYAEDGFYDIDLTCFDEDVTLRAVDAVTGKASDKITISIENQVVQDFQLCSEDCNLSLTIESNEEDACTYDDVMITAVVSGGSGNYQYAWDNGETTETIPYSGAIDYCLVVTDLDTECSESFCKPVFFQDSLGLDAIAILDLGCEVDMMGSLLLTVYTGELPINAEIEGTSTQITELYVEYNLGSFAEGEYTVELTDSKGCVNTIPTQIRDVDQPQVSLYGESENNYVCEGEANTIYAYTQYQNLVESYQWSDGSIGETLTVTTAGTYCVDITLTNGCVGSGCIDMIDFASTFDPINIIEYCGNGNYWFDYQDQPLFIDTYNNEYSFIINPSNPETIPVNATPQQGSSCSFQYEYQFVDNSALGNFQVSNTTCNGCSDGYITFTNESESTTCDRCQFNQTSIYKLSDLQTGDLIDYSLNNDQQNLSAGDYVLIGTFSDNPQGNAIGCVRVRQAFTVE